MHAAIERNGMEEVQSTNADPKSVHRTFGTELRVFDDPFTNDLPAGYRISAKLANDVPCSWILICCPPPGFRKKHLNRSIKPVPSSWKQHVLTTVTGLLSSQ